MYKKTNDTYSFTINKINYTLEELNNSIEIYETENPSKTGFVFEGEIKHFITFINNITDIAEEILEKNETKKDL